MYVTPCIITARRYASAGTSYDPVSVCHKSVFYRNDRTNRAGFWHAGFLPYIPHRAVRKYGYLQKLGYFPLRFCSKLRTWKISPRQVDLVVNKARRSRRRQRSSLLTTPIYDNRRVVAVYYKSLDFNPLTPLLRFVVNLLYNLFLQLARF